VVTTKGLLVSTSAVEVMHGLSPGVPSHCTLVPDCVIQTAGTAVSKLALGISVKATFGRAPLRENAMVPALVSSSTLTISPSCEEIREQYREGRFN
jgi:hypothetical protein